MAEREWITLTREYEGFPLYLRLPLRLNYDALQAQFPVRVVITHTFSFRRFDGTPEPEYNDTLLEFDLSLVTAFDRGNVGQVVLVETFGGKRAYYYYVASAANIDASFQQLKSRYLGHKIELRIESDPTWQFIRKYSADFFPEV